MENSKQIDVDQNIKGNDNVQQQLIIQGNMYVGLNKEQVLDLIRSNCLIDVEKITEIVKDIIESIKEENRVSPTKRIFVPIIQQLSYCLDDDVLQQTYKSLLQSSMDKTKIDLVHPAYINIISQLNSDEIKVLDKLANLTVYPVIDLKRKIGNQTGEGTIVVSNFSDIGFNVCDNPMNIGLYIENLERLKLIEIPWTMSFVDKRNYDKVKNHPYIQKLIKNTVIKGVETKFEFSEKIMRLTTMGRNFLNICTRKF